MFSNKKNFDIVMAVSEDILISPKSYIIILQIDVIISYPNGSGGRLW